MESDNTDLEEQEVTVEVLPQTVAEIIYLQDGDLQNGEDHPHSTESYELGNDIARFAGKSLVLDSTEYVVLQATETDELDGHFLSDHEFDYAFNKPSDTNFGIGEFICTQCNYKCRSQSSLNSHRLVHNEQYVKCHYNCIECGQQFDKQQSLSHHFRNSHAATKFACSSCKFVCIEEWDLLKHLAKHEAKQKFPCDACKIMYDSAMKLVNHQKTHVTNLLYACNKCDASFETTAEVSTHLRTMHSRLSKNFIEFKDTPEVDDGEKVKRRKTR